MCNRFVQLDLFPWLADRYQVYEPIPNDWIPNYNVAPRQRAAVVRRSPEDGQNHVDMLEWGLVPHWSKERRPKMATFNARSEGIQTAPSFRSAYGKGRRCVIPVTGFYEWKTYRDGTKEPFFISRRDGSPLSFAGLWEGWKDPESDEWVKTFTIATCEPNMLVSQIHNRMPVILADENVPTWLGHKPVPHDELYDLLRACPDDQLRFWAVDPAVGNVRNRAPDLHLPYSAPTQSPFPLDGTL